jgi:hypothetical protein
MVVDHRHPQHGIGGVGGGFVADGSADDGVVGVVGVVGAVGAVSVVNGGGINGGGINRGSVHINP